MEWAPSGFRGFQGFDFGQNPGRFGFHADTHGVIVCLGEFAGFEFKIQITQILVNNILALFEIERTSLLVSAFCITAGEKNIDKYAGEKYAAENLDQHQGLLWTHISVS